MNFLLVKGDSFKNGVSYRYQNNQVKCIANGDEYNYFIETNLSSKIDLKDKVFSPLLVQACLSFQPIILLVGILLAFIVFGFNKTNRKYHGAEHKTLNACENGFYLDYENVRSQSCYSKRCGGSHLVYVVLIGLILNYLPLLFVFKVLLNPIFTNILWKIKNSNLVLVKIITWPFNKTSYLLQTHMTTLEPEKEHIEIAIKSMEKLIDLCSKDY